MISGPGLVNLFGFTHGVTGRATGRACGGVGPGVEESDLPAAISRMRARISELGFDLDDETTELIEALRHHDAGALAKAQQVL